MAAEADAIAALVGEAAEVYGFDPGAVIALGYSNGANLALASLARHPHAYAGAILLRPAVVPEEPSAGDLAGTPVLVVLGDAGAYGPQADAAVAFLEERGAAVHVERLEAGHDLTAEDGAAVAGWLRALDREGR